MKLQELRWGFSMEILVSELNPIGYFMVRSVLNITHNIRVNDTALKSINIFVDE